MGLIELEDIEFAYGERRVLRGVDLEVQERRVTVLVGLSGSGKSTILRLIAGLETPQRGRLSIGGQVASAGRRVFQAPESRGVTMVFQDLALWPHMSAGQTLDFVLGPGVARQERRHRIQTTLAAFGLDGRIDARPAELSGGERQRLALARALVTRPRILLMDEPLANLDPPLRLALLEEIRNLRHRFDVTILYVTHNPLETFALGDRAAVVREGRIEQVGSPREIYARPCSAFVASLFGRCALLSGKLRDGHVETAFGSLPATDAGGEGGEVSVVIRPEDVCVDGTGPFTGRVESVASLGGSFESALTGPGWRLWALTRDEPIPGSAVRFAVNKSATVPPAS
jgi:iron(III) transport system ATP-binding protein